MASEHCFFQVRAELVGTDVVEISCRASGTKRTGVEMEASCLPLKWLGGWRGPLSLLDNFVFCSYYGRNHWLLHSHRRPLINNHCFFSGTCRRQHWSPGCVRHAKGT